MVSSSGLPLSNFARCCPTATRWTAAAITLAALGLAAALAIYQVIIRCYYVAQAPLYGDGFLYFAVGRGLLNGLSPYKDLLESKPPGMFLLAAASLTLGGERLAGVLQVLLVPAIPTICMGVVLRETRGRPPMFRAAALCVACVFGCGAAIYVVQRAWGFQTELFGTVASLLYLLGLCWSDRFTRTQLACCCLFVTLSVGLKEPYLTVALICAALLRKPLLKGFVIPAAVAGIVGVAALVCLGSLGAYFQVYLPGIVYFRAAADHSLLFRGLYVIRVLKDLTWFSSDPLFGYSVFSLWLSLPAFWAPERPWPWLLASAIVFAVGVWFWHFSVLYLQLLQVLQYRLPWDDSFFLWLSLRYAGLGLSAVLGLLILLFRQRPLFWAVLRAAAAAFAAVALVGIGSFLPQHYLFPVPIYMCLLVIAVRSFAGTKAQIVIAVVLLCLTIALPFTAFPRTKEIEQMRVMLEDRRLLAAAKARAEEIDVLMDACGFGRYVDLSRGDDFIGLTQHSPLSLPWEQDLARQGNRDMQERVATNLRDAPLVLVGTGQTVTGRTLIPRLVRAEPALPALWRLSSRDAVPLAGAGQDHGAGLVPRPAAFDVVTIATSRPSQLRTNGSVPSVPNPSVWAMAVSSSMNAISGFQLARTRAAKLECPPPESRKYSSTGGKVRVR